MLYFPKVLSIITTRRCTAACEHCCFQCTPQSEPTLTRDQICGIIDDASTIKSLKVVVFTGGECFLLGEDLYEGIRRAKQARFTTRFVSNGYWGATRAATKIRIGKLVASGLDEANFSTGDNHSKYVPVDAVRRAAVACAQAGIFTSIMIETFSESRFDLHAFVAEPEFRRLLELGKISLMPSIWIRVRDSAPISCPSGASLQSLGPRPCTDIFNTLSIAPDLRASVCCGLPQHQIDELSAGTWRPGGLAAMVAGYECDAIKAWISVEGPGAIVDYCRSLDPDISIPETFGHVCEACRFIYSNEELGKLLRNRPPEFLADVVALFRSKALLACTAHQPTDGKVCPSLYDEVRKRWTLESVFQFWETMNLGCARK